MAVSIREIELSDFKQVLELLQQLWPDKELHQGALLKVFTNSARSPDNIYLCMEIAGNVVGFCSLAVRENLRVEGLIAHIDEIIIDELYRRRGLGAELLQAALAAARNKGCKVVELDSAFYRVDAHRFYLKEGFEKRAYLFAKEI